MGSAIEWIKQAAAQRTHTAEQLKKRAAKLREALSAGEVPPEDANARIDELTRKAGEQDSEARNLEDFIRRFGS